MDSATQTLTAPCQPLPPLISRARAAELLDCTDRSVDRYIRRGLLVAHRDPATFRVGIELPGVEALAARRLVIT